MKQTIIYVGLDIDDSQYHGSTQLSGTPPTSFGIASPGALQYTLGDAGAASDRNTRPAGAISKKKAKNNLIWVSSLSARFL